MGNRTAVTVSGRRYEVDADDDTPLLYVLRNHLGLKGPASGAESVCAVRVSCWSTVGPLSEARAVTPAAVDVGPSAGSVGGEVANMLCALGIPESQQRIFQSDAAALEEVQRVGGAALTIGFAVAKDLTAGRLTHVNGPGLDRSGEWCAATLAPSARRSAVSELVRFITTPRCTQAMIRGSGVGVTRFRPKVHVTLWS